MIVIRPSTPSQIHCSLLNEYRTGTWPKHAQIIKHAIAIKSDLIVALKTELILFEEMRLKMVFPTLEINAKIANKM